MDSNRHKLSALVMDPEFEKLQLALNVPNFFSIIRAEGIEIRHSNFLAWLLDPKGSHNLNAIFLKWFLKDIFSDNKIQWANEFMTDSIEFSKVRVFREWNRIDILLVTSDFVICIENKVWAREHGDQLTRYRRVITEHFPNHQHAFVFLNPDGYAPVNEEDANVYVVYTYEQVKKNLDIIFDIYSASLPDRVRIYLEDYDTILRREIMRDHEAIEIAKQIYRNHKEALDFIYQNAQEEILDVTSLVSQAVEEKGYILGSLNRNIVRFLTQRLERVIPRTARYFRNKESFLFEFIIEEKRIKFQTAISPGNEVNREILCEALNSVEDVEKGNGKVWFVHTIENYPINRSDDTFDDLFIVEIINKLLADHEEVIDKIEEAILKVEDRLVEKPQPKQLSSI